MAKRTAKKNPDVKSRRGKHRGKGKYEGGERYVSEYTIEKAKKSGSPWVELDPSRGTADPVFIVNWSDVEGDRNGIELFQFGQIGTTFLAVLNQSLEDGLETAAGWLAEHAPGMFVDDEYMKERYEDALKELVEAGEDPEDDETISKAQEDAETDLTYTESGYLTSWEWYVNTIDEDSDLGQRIVNKAKNRYRKEYGEDPRVSSYRRGRRRNPGKPAPRQTNPTPRSPAHALAKRLIEGG
jgi:hypothetical protein